MNVYKPEQKNKNGMSRGSFLSFASLLVAAAAAEYQQANHENCQKRV